MTLNAVKECPVASPGRQEPQAASFESCEEMDMPLGADHSLAQRPQAMQSGASGPKTLTASALRRQTQMQPLTVEEKLKRALDDGVAEVLAALEESGRGDAIVLFTADNGPDETVSNAGDSGRYKGAKATLHEGGIRVPTILRWLR